MMVIMRFLILLILSFYSFSASAQVAQDGQCMRAIYIVSNKLKIPIDVLGAVALTETGIKKGKDFTPWPWALNVNGKGFIYKNRKQALKAAKNFLAQGKTSMDIGCMQMNWRWHKSKFGSSLVNAFDPVKNVMVAGRYLKQHYKKYGDWTLAIGRYHSGTKRYADLYLKKALVNRDIMRREFGLAPQLNTAEPEAVSIAALRQEGLPSAPEMQKEFLDIAPGALVNFEHVNEPFIALPKAPVSLLRQSSGSFIRNP